MDVAPRGGGVAGTEAAAAVAQDDGVVQVHGPVPGGPPVVQDPRGAVDQEPVEGAVALQHAESGGRHRLVGVEVAAADPGTELLVADGHVEVGAVAAAAAGLLVIEEVLADLGQGIGSPFGEGTVPVAGQGGAQGGIDQGVHVGIEGASQLAAGVEGPGVVQLVVAFGGQPAVVDGVGVALPVLHHPAGVVHGEHRPASGRARLPGRRTGRDVAPARWPR